jgi:hypothetical protein
MTRFTTMFWIGCLLLGFGIFFGIALAEQGVERVNGPMERPVKSQVAAASAPAATQPKQLQTAQPVKSADAKSQKDNRNQPPASIVPSASEAHANAEKSQHPSSDSLVNTVGNKTGDLLQIMAHHSINGVVSFFDAIFK